MLFYPFSCICALAWFGLWFLPSGPVSIVGVLGLCPWGFLLFFLLLDNVRGSSRISISTSRNSRRPCKFPRSCFWASCVGILGSCFAFWVLGCMRSNSINSSLHMVVSCCFVLALMFRTFCLALGRFLLPLFPNGIGKGASVVLALFFFFISPSFLLPVTLSTSCSGGHA